MKLTVHSRCESIRPRICVLFPGALGDFICFLPTLQILARDAEVDLLTGSEFADLAPAGVAVGSLERPEVSKLFAADVADSELLKEFFGAFAAVYSWLGSQQKQFALRLQSSSRGDVRLFPFRPVNSQTHQIDYYLSCLNHAAVPQREPLIELRHDAIRWCDDFFARHALHRRSVIALGAGSGAREKNWPEEFFLAVAEWWRETTGGAVVLMVGPAEEERGGFERLQSRCVIARGLRLSQAAALLQRCHLYLGNDSGISHLAAAAGVRTVALFGPSVIEQWAPRGNRVTIVSHNIECSPCPDWLMKSCSHRACLTALLPGEVIDVLTHLPEVVTLTRKGVGITV